ncbi:molybdate ABC transporter substrate-binding protein [Leptospira perolatii]|uniref:Molybdate ABC transporter substrate-binding protein n=1 Tax=Leptospira perolatii TaxID=2023191 RepID=A0A2M9ZLT4_9LEPT|nr:molybdate ABC transporter substrate-binding protein [Leptospira perolatii]PJZ69735.1 molybdate ABC transporter substrate-binding protein [Leptospira perolatii]PJZ73050.1 molybdate ABC transporter substrate-binding protein [Leptospira perolatii]
MVNFFRKYFIYSIFPFLLLCLASCRPSSSGKLTIAVAANLQHTIIEIEKEFEAETKIPVDVVLGSSGKLTTQIKEGAPYDVFISADMNYPENLFKSGWSDAPPKPYARGLLVLWSRKADLSKQDDLNLLLSPNIKKIAIANPETAPYGKAAVEALKELKIYDKVKHKLVFGESISQTNQFIISQAADLGITSKSTVIAEELRGKEMWIDIDPALYNAITQGMIILKHGKESHPEESRKFYDFIASEKSKAIFLKYGYLLE